jgi:hypothetical protein
MARVVTDAGGQQQPLPSSRLGQPSGRLRGGSGQRLISSAPRWK